jgi:hypothetical protein
MEAAGMVESNHQVRDQISGSDRLLVQEMFAAVMVAALPASDIQRPGTGTSVSD